MNILLKDNKLIRTFLKVLISCLLLVTLGCLIYVALAPFNNLQVSQMYHFGQLLLQNNVLWPEYPMALASSER